MSEKMPQTYANHAKMVPLYHYVLGGILILNFGYTTWQLWQHPGLETARQLLVAVAAFLMYAYLRLFPLKVQDRLIRLEMRLRLATFLPADLMARFGELRPGQLVALRFASDAEMAGLVRRVLAGELKTGKEIKQAIVDWQPDYFRA